MKSAHMATRRMSFPEAYLRLKAGKAIRISGWRDRVLILIPEKKLYKGCVEHPLLAGYIERLGGYDTHITVGERFQLVYNPSDAKAICSDGIMGPHIVDNYTVTAQEMQRLDWCVVEVV